MQSTPTINTNNTQLQTNTSSQIPNLVQIVEEVKRGVLPSNAQLQVELEAAKEFIAPKSKIAASDKEEKALHDAEQLLSFRYTYTREGGVLIDSTPCERLHQVVRQNPFALGYLANHPPKGRGPNVMTVDVPKKFTAKDIPYIPTWHENKDTIDSVVTTFVAMDDICDGDEIFLDYEMGDLKDQSVFPEWYHYIPESAYTDGIIDDIRQTHKQ